MAATVRVSIWTGGTEGAGSASAETGIKFNRDATQSGTTAPIPIPTTTGTNFSWHKNLALEVTATDATAISNRRVRLNAAPSTGLGVAFLATGTYAAPAAADTDAGTDGATPTGYTAMTTSNQVYDSASVSAGATGRNGQFTRVALGVSSTFTGGAGSNTAVPSLIYTYDEA